MYSMQMLSWKADDDDWKQIKSFLTGAFTICVVWCLNGLLTGLHSVVPDKFDIDSSIRRKRKGRKTSEKEEAGDDDCDREIDDCDDDDDDDSLGSVDPWNEPLLYVSTQPRRMMRSSMNSMANIKNNIGELPKRLKRKHWPWETKRRRRPSSSSTLEEDNDDEKQNNIDDDDNNNNIENSVTEEVSRTKNKLIAKSEEKIQKSSNVNPEENTEPCRQDRFRDDTSRNDHDGTNKSSSSCSSSSSSSSYNRPCNREEKQLCIGSIFGLDVGGTLAKLVYFEKKTVVDNSDTLKVRRRGTLISRIEHHINNDNKSKSKRNTLINGIGASSISSLSSRTKSRRYSIDDSYDAYTDHNNFINDDNDDHDDRTDGNYSLNNNNQSESISSSFVNPPKRSLSLLGLSTNHEVQKAEALDRFYAFARRLDMHQDSIRDIKLSFYCRELGGEFHFIRFETRKMKDAMDLIRVNNLHMNIQSMGATGGGAHKFADVWETELGIIIVKQNELDSLVAGMQFVLSTVVGECYTFQPKKDPSKKTNKEQPGSDETKNDYNSLQWWSRKVQRDSISYSSAYPYMLVTIGTGVSVLRVDGPRRHERVSGSTIGGGTFWGLMRLLTDVENFEDSMKLAEMGDLSKVDMMVGDIYGENSDALDKLGLAANIVASSFGKLVSKEDPAQGLTQEDLARALLSLVTNNIGQVAYLNAKLHNTPRIYFVGSFLRENMISQRRLSYAINYWSKGEMEALFLEHEGYFGALGAFLMSQNIECRKGGFYQWESDC